MSHWLGLPRSVWSNHILEYLDVHSFLVLRLVNTYCNTLSIEVLQASFPIVRSRIQEICASPIYVQTQSLMATGESLVTASINNLSKEDFFDMKNYPKIPSIDITAYDCMVTVTGLSRPEKFFFQLNFQGAVERVRNIDGKPALQKVDLYLQENTLEGLAKSSNAAMIVYQCVQVILSTARQISNEFVKAREQLKEMKEWERVVEKLEARKKLRAEKKPRGRKK